MTSAPGRPPEPEARLRAEAVRLLAEGRFAEGFALYSRWQETPAYAAVSARQPGLGLGAPRWTGQDVAGKRVLVVSEEGLGDQIMYARFVPLLTARGAEVTWLCPGGLARLFAEGLGVRAVAAEGTVELARPDFHVPSSGLAAPFFPPLAAPPQPPYLAPPPANVVPGLRIGVMSAGNPRHRNDANRSLPPELAQELLGLPGAVSLAAGDTGARDFYDTATVVAGLDLVVTVDTAVAHLAAAMGRPTWVLLPFVGLDWRWGDGVRSPWYPQARLFRQPAAGDWRSVLDAVSAALIEQT